MYTLKNIFQAVGLTLVVLLALPACEDISDVNVDPNAFTEVRPHNLLTGAMKNSLDLIGGTMNNEMFLTYGQYAGGIGGQFPRYFFTDNGVNQFWNTMYVDVLKNTQVVIDNFSNDPNAANQVEIAKIWRAYVYSVAVSTWGPVPFTDALGDDLEVGYDDETLIYTEILNDLRTAAAKIDPAGDALTQDPLFGGNNNKWVAFANSLRLKLALRLQEGFPTLAEEHGREVMGAGVALITENANNAILRWGSDEENWSHYYRRYIFGNNIAQEPRVSDWYYLHLKSYKDPRMAAVMEPSEVPYTVTDRLYYEERDSFVTVNYDIPYLGRPAGNTNTIPNWDVTDDINPMQGIFEENYSFANLATYFAPDASYPLITADEVKFMQAEAALLNWGGNNTPQAYYEDAIRTSFARYQVDGADAYLAQDGVAWGTSADGLRNFVGVVNTGVSTSPLDHIITQRWLASFWQGHDAWCLLRRTRILDIPPHMEPDGPGLSRGYTNVPERMIYAPEELGLNSNGYQSGLDALGGSDELATLLQFAKAPNYPNWPNESTDLNFDFATQFYGDTVEDLIAAGISFTIQ